MLKHAQLITVGRFASPLQYKREQYQPMLLVQAIRIKKIGSATRYAK